MASSYEVKWPLFGLTNNYGEGFFPLCSQVDYFRDVNSVVDFFRLRKDDKRLCTKRFHFFNYKHAKPVSGFFFWQSAKTPALVKKIYKGGGEQERGQKDRKKGSAIKTISAKTIQPWPFPHTDSKSHQRRKQSWVQTGLAWCRKECDQSERKKTFKPQRQKKRRKKELIYFVLQCNSEL